MANPGLEVLLVDDEPIVLKAISLLLRRRGYQVTATTTAADAKHWIEQKRFDVVITDVLLAGEDGLTVIQAARKTQPQARVVVISGGGDYLGPSHGLTLGKALGAAATLLKPFNGDELLAAIKGGQSPPRSGIG